MCGIAGIISLTDEPIPFSRSVFSQQVSRLQHRGPDGTGIVCSDRFYFGHTRLSIIDLSETANQPMSDRENTILITFNGEIYNYNDLRNELIKLGHDFQTHSDTEVIVEAFKAWGIECIHKFNGMFAFAIYDKIKKECFIVRDRLGIKPLFYAIFNGCLIFASELKGIVYYPEFQRKMNLRAVSNFLSYRSVFGKETLFSGVNQLEPGYFIHFNGINTECVQYWDIDLKKVSSSGEKKIKNEIKALVDDAVEKCTIADVPVGTLLSGGIDSSIILGTMATNSEKKVLSYSVKFNESGYDETYFSDLVARRFQSENTKIVIEPESYIRNITNYIKIKDHPAGMHNEIAMFLMSKKISNQLKVVLSGEGADELFSGYGRLFRSPFDYQKIKWINRAPVFMKPFLSKFFATDALPFQSEFEHFCHNYTYFPLEKKNSLYNDMMLRETANDAVQLSNIHSLFHKSSSRSYYDKISYVLIKLHLPALLLMLDSTTMANGVESRVPFLDHRLVQKAFEIPSFLKLKWKSKWSRIKSIRKSVHAISEKNDTTKYILKESFRGFLPDEIIERDKMPFPVPLNEWFKDHFYEYFKKEVLSADSMVNAIFEKDKLAEWAFNDENFKDPAHGRRLWIVLNLELWMKEYFK